MSQTTFRRARRPEQKRERREAILRAARDLADGSRVRDVSLSCIASAVGLAKSNVVRYFGTREEIYLALTIHELRGFELAVLDRLARPDGPVDVVAALTDALEQRPLLCDLLGECSSTLERNVSLDAAREYKLDMIRIVREQRCNRFRFADAPRIGIALHHLANCGFVRSSTSALGHR